MGRGTATPRLPAKLCDSLRALSASKVKSSSFSKLLASFSTCECNYSLHKSQ